MIGKIELGSIDRAEPLCPDDGGTVPQPLLRLEIGENRPRSESSILKNRASSEAGSVKLEIVLTVVLMTGWCAAAQTVPSPRPNPSIPYRSRW